LGSGLNFEGVVHGFGHGDTIELIDPTASPISATYDSSRDLLVLRDTSNAVVSKIHMVGDFASNAFRVNSVGNGAFDVTLTSEMVSEGAVGATLSDQQGPAFVGSAAGPTAVGQPGPVDFAALSAASAPLPSLPSHATSSFGFGPNDQLPTLAAFLRPGTYGTPTTLLPLHG
jgi:hypothetical protein